MGGPSYRTDVVQLAGGAEARNSRWSYPLNGYDAGYGVRTQAQLETLLAYFHAVSGMTHGFRWKDWADWKSCTATGTPADTDQTLGTGDGDETRFQLVKVYATGVLSKTRIIQKPVTGTVVVSLDDVSQPTGWSVNTVTGVVTFTAAPGAGVVVKAGYEFDVPCRFASDTLQANWDAWLLHSAQVPIAEIRIPILNIGVGTATLTLTELTAAVS
jgi:uncharacterized protein (TIGR02217 family)